MANACLIDGNAIKTADVFDFETKNSYSIRVQTTDAGGATFSQSITVSITNEAEPAISDINVFDSDASAAIACSACHSSCATCTGALISNCITCADSNASASGSPGS